MNLVVFLFSWVLTSALYGVDATTFSNWFAAYKEHRLTVPAPAAHQRYKIQYVFIAGFLNETKSSYFRDNIRQLRRMGVLENAIHVLRPSSTHSIEDNSRELLKYFRRIDGDRLVLIAHSKGAVETFSFALQNADFIRSRVLEIFLVQGAFGGSALADYLLGQVTKPYHRFVEDRFLMGAIRTLSTLLPLDGGLASLSTRFLPGYFDSLLSSYQDAIPFISDKIHYIRSHTRVQEAALPLRLGARYLEHYGPNDGLVLLKDQQVAGVGKALLVLKADHSDLLMAKPLSQAPESVRKSLMKTIFTAVELSQRACLENLLLSSQGILH